MLTAIFVAGLVAIGFIWLNRRWYALQEQMWRNFAAEEKLEYFGKLVPKDLPDVAPGKLGIRFCVSGTRDGVRVICYQFRILERNRWWCTAVGAKLSGSTSANMLGAFDRMLQKKGWLLLWHSQWKFGSRKIDTDDVVSVWNRIRAEAAHAAPPKETQKEEDTAIVIRPRHERLL